MSYKKGIDVSEHNGVIDWAKVKASGIEFAMIRAGMGSRADYKADRNFKEADRVGIKCGAWWFSYALNPAQARQEAAICIGHLKGYRIDMPVAFDLEYDSVNYAKKKGVYIGMTEASAMARAFLEEIKKAGYIAVNYTNADYLNRYFDKALSQEYPVWLAQWPSSAPDLDKPPRACDLWQYSAKGKVPGINTDVDMDVCYADYTKRQEPEKEAAKTMTDKEIYEACMRHANSLPLPEWAKEEYQAAIDAGITDGTKPMQPIQRYQAAIMCLRAARQGG